MSRLPTGTVTLLFTDIEGSTRLLHELGDGYADILAEHRRVLREAFGRYGGVEVDTQGDAFFYAFARATDAAAAAAEGQSALAEGSVRVRMGVHTGEPHVTDEGYVGADVHRAARITSAGHGGQVLLSEATRRLLDPTFELRDLGEHRLKDLDAPEHLFQLGNGAFPPLKSLNNTNLPLQLEPLLGRKRELAQLLQLVRGEGVRLVTLTGPGGIGKTRLALEVASELVDDFAHGVWFVELGSILDPDYVEPTIAGVLGARGELDEHIGDKRFALLLDNLEQIVDASPRLVRLLSVCPNLVLVTTSREPLHVAGEREYPVRALAEAPAVELFRQRAAAVEPDFDAPYAELAGVCARLDSLPLAIELAAARARTLTPGELRARLEQRLPLLSKGRRDAPERQRTLRATIDWSYQLLKQHERSAFAQLGVFAGGWTLAAAETVCELDVDTLESLVDKSLVRHVEGRFSMLETIREYAGERLAGLDDADAVRRRHAEWYVSLAESAEPELAGAHADLWLARLSAEIDNIRIAIEWCVANERVLGLRLTTALWLFWVHGGHTKQALRWLAAAWDDDVAVEVRQRALRAKGGIAMSTYDVPELIDASDKRLVLARATNDSAEAAGALNGLAVAARYEGDLPRARELFEEALAHARQTEDALRISGIVANLGQVAEDLGDYDEARQLFDEDLRISREQGSALDVAWALANVASVAVLQGRPDDARAPLAEALDTAGRVGDVGRFPMLLTITAMLAAADGDAAAAARLVGSVEGLTDRLGGTILPTAGKDLIRTAEQAREELGAVEYEARKASGRTSSPEEALAFARTRLD